MTDRTDDKPALRLGSSDPKDLARQPEFAEIADLVLDQLDPAENRELWDRLRADPDQVLEVQKLRKAYDLIGAAAMADPPSALRKQILAAAESHRTMAKPNSNPSTQAVRGSGQVPTLSGARSVRLASTWAALAASILAMVLGVDSYRVRRELRLERELTAALQEPNVVKSFVLAGTGDYASGFGNVALDLDNKKGALVFKNLKPLESGNIYRLWAKVGDKAVPCGDFRAASDGSALTQFRVPVESYTAPLKQLFVTIEPAQTRGGSGDLPVPTGRVVMASV